MDKRQIIAGRQQARTGTVMQQSLSQKVEWFLRELQEATAAGGGVVTKSALLQKVYWKCGCTKSGDGSLVCSTPLVGCEFFSSV